MDTYARPIRTWHGSLSLWGCWVVWHCLSLSVYAQPARSPATLGPILIEPDSADPVSNGENPFQPVPARGPQFPEPTEPLPTEYPPEWLEPEAAPPAPNVPSSGKKFKCLPNYWIISTRDCAQSGTPCGADQCTKYVYIGPNGQEQPRTAEEFLYSLRPEVPVCMFVHGSLIKWEQMRDEGHQTYEWLKSAQPDKQFQMVFLTWPSNRQLVVPPIDFSILGQRSSFNGLYLARVLSRMPSNINVSIIGHSHGARLTISAMNLLGGGTENGYRMAPRQTPLPRVRVMTAAAALDHHWIDPDERYGHALDSVESLMNLRNYNDFWLRLYPVRLPIGRESLGRVGFNTRDQQSLGINYTKVRDVELSSMLGIRHIWPWFYNQPEIARALTPYLFFQGEMPHSVTLKRDPRSPTGNQMRIITESPPGTPRTSDASNSTLVRGTLPRRPLSTRDAELPPTTTEKSSVAPSAYRVFGSPLSRSPRK